MRTLPRIARDDYLLYGEEIPTGVAGRNSPFGSNDGVSQRFTGPMRDAETALGNPLVNIDPTGLWSVGDLLNGKGGF